ncbi:MAG: hypothetical protein AAGG07_05200 [Planctomycetota bacterium]
MPLFSTASRPILRRTATIAGLTAMLAVRGTALGQDNTQDREPYFTFRVAGLDAITPAPKDAAAYRALRMLGLRLPEIPNEIEPRNRDNEEIAEALKLGWQTLAGGLSIAVVPTDGAPGIGMTAVATPLEGADMEAIATAVAKLGIDRGFRPEILEDGTTFSTPFGSAKLMWPDEGTLRFAFGEAEPREVPWADEDLPAGATPIVSMTLDLPALSPVIENTVLMMSPPEAQQQLAAYGLIGPNAYTIKLIGGVTDDATHLVARIGNAHHHKNKLGGDARLDRAFLSAAPLGTTTFDAGVFSLALAMDQLETLAEESGMDFVAMADEWLGTSVRETLIDPLGPQYMVYRSRETGGGGLVSLITITELSDTRAFLRGHARLIENLNNLAQENLNGYVRFQPAPALGPGAYTIAFPGLPIPIEPTWIVTDGALVLGATPAGVRAALDQLRTDGPSVLQNPAFAESLPAPHDEHTLKVQFMDSAFYAERGYMGASLLSAALANAVRSPSDPLRDPGVLLPGYIDLTTGVTPIGTITRWEGDDLVFRSRGDRSAMVGAAMLAGNADLVAPIALLAGFGAIGSQMGF